MLVLLNVVRNSNIAAAHPTCALDTPSALTGEGSCRDYMARDLPSMRYTRRDFLSAAAAAAGIGGSVRCSRPSAPSNRLSGAPGGVLGIDYVALPGYCHDLEKYL